MNLSLKLIRRHLPLGSTALLASRKQNPDPMRLTHLRFYDRSTVLDESAAYLLPVSELTADFRCPKGIALILLGPGEPGQLAHADADILLWEPPANMGPREQFNLLSALFQEYRDMEMKLVDRLIASAPPAEIASIAEQFLGNPILLLDEGYSLLLKPSRTNPLDWESGKFPQAPTLSSEVVDQIRMSREYLSRDRHQGLFYLPNDTLDCGVLFLHVHQEDFSFFIAVLEMEQPITPADYQLLLYLSRPISMCLRIHRFSRADFQSFLPFLTRLLQNQKIELPEFNRQLQTQHWGISDHYVCFVAEPDLWNQKDTQSFQLCRLIEGRFRGSVAFSYEDRIVCIVNLDRAGIERQVFLQLLSQFIRDQLLKVGVSYGFQDFVSLPNYFHQALAALELGRQFHPDEWNYRFEKYVLEYFIRYGTSKMDGRYLCHPDLLTLLRYDRENNTELLPTLRVYLSSGQNATTSAAELFIHRNTLYQRLGKIETLMSDNLSSPETRLYLQISYSIVDFDAI